MFYHITFNFSTNINGITKYFCRTKMKKKKKKNFRIWWSQATSTKRREIEIHARIKIHKHLLLFLLHQKNTSAGMSLHYWISFSLLYYPGIVCSFCCTVKHSFMVDFISFFFLLVQSDFATITHRIVRLLLLWWFRYDVVKKNFFTPLHIFSTVE